MALASTRQLRSQGLVSVHAHRTEGVTGSEGRAGANGDVNGDVDGDGAGTKTGVEASEGAQDGNGVGGGDSWMNAGWERGRKREQ